MILKYFFILLTALSFLLAGQAFSKQKIFITKNKTTVQKLDKQTNDELAKNEEIIACYNNAKAGREKQHGVVFVELDVGSRSELILISLSKTQSTLSPEVGNCIVQVLKNLAIPFISKDRNKKVLTLFRF